MHPIVFEHYLLKGFIQQRKRNTLTGEVCYCTYLCEYLGTKKQRCPFYISCGTFLHHYLLEPVVSSLLYEIACSKVLTNTEEFVCCYNVPETNKDFQCFLSTAYTSIQMAHSHLSEK